MQIAASSMVINDNDDDTNRLANLLPSQQKNAPSEYYCS